MPFRVDAAQGEENKQQQAEKLLEEIVHQLPDMPLLLEVVINGEETGKVVSVEHRQGHYYVSSAEVKEWGLPLPLIKESEVAVDTLPDIKAEYDGARQQLQLTVPTHWLPEQSLTVHHKRAAGALSDNVPGFLINYDLFSTYLFQNNRVDTASAWTEQRLFGRYGVLSNTGTYNHSFTNNSGRYTRFDTHWLFEDQKRMLQYKAGDIISAALNWGNAVWIGGINISRNFTLRPDLITYPLPEFKGQAALPSTVDLFINDYQHMSANMKPGPFSLSTLPSVNGAGTATMTVTDAQGKKVTVQVPFYVTTELLAKGLSDFSLSAGKLRKNYGVKNFSYGENVFSGLIRYGVTNSLTLQSRAEAGKELVNGSVGALLGLWHFGVLEGGYSASRSPERDSTQSTTAVSQQLVSGDKKAGHQSIYGYSYNGRYFGVSGRRVLNTSTYNDLGSYSSILRNFRRQDQATLSLNLDRFGSLGFSYIGMYNNNNNRFRLLSVNYSKGLWADSNFFASVNKEIGASGYSANLMLTIPFKQDSYITMNSSRDTKNRWTSTLNYAKNTPTEGGWGGNVSVGRTGKQYSQQSRVEYANRNFTAQGGVYGDSHYTGWAELQGAVVMMDGHAYASRPIYDSFTLVSTEGYGNVPVYYENQQMGTTDTNGYLLIPYVTSYYDGKYAIDPLHLPADVDTPVVERRRMTKTNQGMLINFPVGKSDAITVVLQDKQGKPLPVGSHVQLEGTDYTTYVGWDGETYLQKLAQQNSLKVRLVDNDQHCRAEFTDQILQDSEQGNPITCVKEVED
ncbi:MAG: fimbria/pilus outer membrane usher protein [Enterobacteriaceae bacterium]